jgi:hypothetical protein
MRGACAWLLVLGRGAQTYQRRAVAMLHQLSSLAVSCVHAGLLQCLVQCQTSSNITWVERMLVSHYERSNAGAECHLS